VGIGFILWYFDVFSSNGSSSGSGSLPANTNTPNTQNTTEQITIVDNQRSSRSNYDPVADMNRRYSELTSSSSHQNTPTRSPIQDIPATYNRFNVLDQLDQTNQDSPGSPTGSTDSTETIKPYRAKGKGVINRARK